jgi:EAL domain-containing protein (putative c-di-GMP-specific phosphodiesterase class I)/ActR/RegA family two-component response regulator
MNSASPDLPAAPAAATAEPADAGGMPAVLLLDDDPFTLELLTQMLHDMGYPQVETATRAQAALAALQERPQAVGVIVCDLNMPGMDGIEFLQRLNATAFRGAVILLSGEGLRILHTVRKLLGGGRLAILGALEKPASRAALKALLDCWQPHTGTAQKAPRLAITAADLHAANRERQWVLHYQPTVDLGSGKAAGMEALIRLNHPQHGLVYPDNFIGMAEDCGAIDALTEWVLREAMLQLVRWQALGLQLRVAVNLSMDNLRSPQFVRRVGALARETGASPQNMTLEVTESRLMSPGPTPLESLVRLRMQRFSLAIDDFGTGHSSLAQLRDVPFNKLKVDRGFVHGARHNQIIRPMLEGSIGIARRLGMTSVAEGVETEDDWQLLREIGCDQAQGWFIAKAMPVEHVLPWLEAWKRRWVTTLPSSVGADRRLSHL